MVFLIRRYLNSFPILKLLIKFCIVGATAALINFSFFFSLTRWFGLWYVWSSMIGFVISAAFNFTANKLWTFGSLESGRVIVGQINKFLVVMFSGLSINTLILFGLADGLQLPKNLAWLIATGIVTFWNFGFNKAWTFRAKPV